MDDMLVKSIWVDDNLSDLQETFDTFWSYNLKLNPNKCVFGVTIGKFLRFMVSQKGIEAKDGQGSTVPERQDSSIK